MVEKGWYRRWFPLMRLVWVAAAGGVWYVMPRWGPCAIALAMVPWAIHAARTGEVGRRTPFDAALLFFVVTAGVSLSVAYDPQGSRAVFPAPIGWGKLWGLVLALLVFYAVVSLRTERERRWTVRLLSGFGTAVALWFMVTNDWDTTATEWDFILRLGQLVQAPLPPLPGHRLNPNVAGGLLALSLPMSLELVAGSARRAGKGSSFWTAWGFTSAALMGLGLLLTGSLGAWTATGGALCLGAVWWLAKTAEGERGRPGEAGGAQRVAAFLGLVAVGAVAGGLALAAIPPLRAFTLESEAVTNRLRIFSSAALMVRDYAFTGCGLGQFPLVHSTYALLIHVPVLVFAHSTPLGVAVEQGVPAALTLLAVWVAAAWMGLHRLANSERPPIGLSAGLLALGVLTIHGSVDSVLYGSRALLLLWMPIGLILAASGGVTRRWRDASWGWWGLAAAAGAALVLGILAWRPLTAAWHANLGAAHQTLVELQAYDWHRFDDPTLDEIRRREDLSAAVAHFERALALDPGQATARTRLAQIALARGAYAEGLTHARTAWEAGHRDAVTRLVLGDALVAQGRVDEAVSVVRGLEWAEARLDGQAFYRYWDDEDWQRATYAWGAVLRLNPEDARVRQAMRRAEEQMARGH